MLTHYALPNIVAAAPLEENVFSYDVVLLAHHQQHLVYTFHTVF